MTSEQFVEKYNQTAAAHYFSHQITLSDELPRKLLHRHNHRVAGGGSISFMLTESGGQVQDITMFDTQAAGDGHRQRQSIAASILIDIVAGPPKAERKKITEQLGLSTGAYGAVVPVGKAYSAQVRIIKEPPLHTLILELRRIRRGKGVTVHAGNPG